MGGRQESVMRSVIVVPTLDIELGKRCALSFSKYYFGSGARVIIVYNGPNNDVASSIYGQSIEIIGAKKSDWLAKYFSKLANCSEELLFGKRVYGRSFGGASNLALAIGYSMGANVIFKIDDDCLYTHKKGESWHEKASNVFDGSKIRFGSYSGQESGGIHRLPQLLGLQFAKFIYNKEETDERLGDVKHTTKTVIKNGCLIFGRKTLEHTCYPVLYERNTHISARGEVYCLKQELDNKGIKFIYDKTLVIQHSPVRHDSLQEWLSAMVIGFDLNLVRKGIFEQDQDILSLEKRKNEISRFRNWIRITIWPADVNANKLVELLDMTGMGFSNRIIREIQIRQAAWRNFITMTNYKKWNQVLQ
jgi:hypothetical protein